MADLNKIVVPKINAHWEDVAYALLYKIPTVDSIKRKHQEDPQKCCKELFKDWLESNNGAAAGPKIWSTIVDKLKDIGVLTAAREEIITELGKMYWESQV